MKEYIEREAVILALGDEPEVWYERDPVEIQERNDYNYYKHCIEAVPAADVVLVKHGRWKYYHKQNKAVCACCSFERDLDVDFGRAITCSNCGTLMGYEVISEFDDDITSLDTVAEASNWKGGQHGYKRNKH